MSKRDKNSGSKGHGYPCASSFLILTKLCGPKAEGHHRDTMSSRAMHQSQSFSLLQTSTQPTFLTWKVKFIFSGMHVSGSRSSLDPYTSEVGFINLIETNSNLVCFSVLQSHSFIYEVYMGCVPGARCQAVLGARRPIFIRHMAPLEICTVDLNLVNGLSFDEVL